MITTDDKDEFAKAYFAFYGISPIKIIDIGNDKLHIYSNLETLEVDSDALKPVTEFLWQLFSERMSKLLAKNYKKQRLNKILYQLATVDVSRVLTTT